MREFLKDNSSSIMNATLLLVVLVLVNLVLFHWFVRFDLTEDKQYSISDVSQEAMAKLDDIVTVKMFFTKDLPPSLLPLSQYIKDILSEYSAYADGKMVIKIIDPADDKATAQEVKSLGIPQVQMNFLEKDKVEVRQGYLGLAIFYGDKSEIIPVIQNQSGFEYEFTSALKKVTADEVKQVGFLVGHGEHGMSSPTVGEDGVNVDYQRVINDLTKSYDVTAVDNSFALESIDTLIVAGPKQELADTDLFMIDQFIMKGGNVIFLVDTRDIDKGLQAKDINTKLEKLVENYGVRVNHNFILDKVNETLPFSSGLVQFFIPYPFWVKITSQNLAKENPIVAKLESFVLPWASSLSVLEKENVTVETLASTSELGWTQSGLVLDPNQDYQPENEGKQAVVAIASGTFKSYFNGIELPADLAEEDKGAYLSEGQAVSRVVVVGDSDFLSDSMVQSYQGNGVLFQNMVDYITLDEDLISIRSRAVTDRPIRELTEAEKTKIKVMGIILAPVLFVLYGLVRLVMRRRKQK